MNRGLRFLSAYIFLLAEELARAGVEACLHQDLATRLARENRRRPPSNCLRGPLGGPPHATLRQNVTSPAAPRPRRWKC